MSLNQNLEYCGFCERVSVVAWVLINGKRVGVDLEGFKEYAAEHWTQFSHIGFEYPNAREHTGLEGPESDSWHTMMKVHFGKQIGLSPAETMKKFTAMIDEVQAAIL